jgi:hypothetical protein
VSEQTATIIAALQADKILQGSFILKQIDDLKNNLRYRTDGTYLSFDDMWLSLEAQIDGCPKLKLETAVPTGTENQYIVKLVQILEQALDDTDRVGQKIIHFESKLKDANSQIKTLRGAFVVWYTLAAFEILSQRGITLPTTNLRPLAESEFARLMGGTVQTVESLLGAVKASIDRLKLHKKTQQEKFDLGKDQANASWTSSFPAFGSTIGESEPEQTEEVEEPADEDTPAFMTITPKVIPAPVYRQASNGGVETSEGVPVVRGDENGLPKLVISNAPVAVQTFQGAPGPSLTVAVVPDEKYDALKEAVKAGPVDAQQFAALLSDEPVKLKPAKITKDPSTIKAKNTAILTFVMPDVAIVVDRVKDGLPEKIKCVVCDRRIRVGQKMFERDGGWAHAVQVECETSTKTVKPPQLPFGDSPDAPPQTKPLESVGPIKATVVGTGDTSQDTIIAQMTKENPIIETLKANPVLATLNPTLAVKAAMMQSPVPDELNDLLDKARKVTMSPEETEEQRRSFTAGNVALDTGRSLEQVRQDVDRVAEAIKIDEPLVSEVQNIPPRKRIAFLEDEVI